jgi:hypothetical protein
MNSIGTVVSILNDSSLLIRVTRPLMSGQTLTVFGRNELPGIKDAGIPYLDFPKGQVRVAAQQANEIYLVERFKESEKTYSALEKGSSGFFAALTVKDVEWSAEYDQQQNLKLTLDRRIKIGDHLSLD